MRASKKHRGQAIVEFGMVALLFTLLAFAIVDFGLLLNTWVRLSSATREAGRLTSVGGFLSDVDDLLRSLALPGVSPSRDAAQFPAGICQAGVNQKECISGSKVLRNVVYYDGSNPAGCVPPACGSISNNLLDDRYVEGGGCHWTVGSPPCAHPARGDWLVLTVSAPGMEIFTPLVRPFFGCGGSQAHCYVDLGSTVTMRFEGL
jgi:hypothetical protein